MTTNARVIASTEKYHAAERQGRVSKLAQRLFVAAFEAREGALSDYIVIQAAFKAAERFVEESERRQLR